MRMLAIGVVLATAWARPQVPAKRLTFEVASVKLAAADEGNGYIKATPGGNGYTVRNVPLKLIFALMYKVPMRQIQGGPDWFGSTKWDMETRADGVYPIDALHAMMQNLLADRFHLRFHTTVHEGNVYALTVDSGGVKMKADESAESFAIPMVPGAEGMVGTRVGMVYLAWFLGQQLQDEERPVVDETGLKGNYDFVLDFEPPVLAQAGAEDARERPTLFVAVKEQLGLRLTKQRGPVTEYVVDGLEKPEEN